MLGKWYTNIKNYISSANFFFLIDLIDFIVKNNPITLLWKQLFLDLIEI